MQWKRLESNHPLMLKGEQGAFNIQSVTLLEPFDPKKGGGLKKHEGPAEIDSLVWNGRTVMLFSPNDLSCAMESKHSTQCRGYVSEDAYKIAINMVLFSFFP